MMKLFEQENDARVKSKAPHSLQEEGTVGRSTISGNSSANGSESRQTILLGRITFLITLVSVAALFGYLSYHFLSESEIELTEVQFGSIADRALCTALENTERKRLGVLSLASIIGGANPDISGWPSEVTVNNFETITKNIVETSKGCLMGFAPLVAPHEVPAFEDHAYKYYEELRMPEPFPEGTALSSFGKGIWSIDPTLNNTDQRYHDVDGATSWGSKNQLLAPMLHHVTGASPKLMMNFHSNPLIGSMIDTMLICADERAQAGESIEGCTSISTTLPNTTSWVQGAQTGPGALLVQPVSPSNYPQMLTGIIVTQLVWGEVMMGTYAQNVCGIHVVLSDDESAYTYEIVKGEATFLGEGDLHLERFDHYAIESVMTPLNLFTNASASYTVTLYPTEDLYNLYSTRNPATASVVVVVVMCFTSFLFLIYDLFVRREFNAKKELLSAKRKFVRFVSHEVRTPLNSVCMGLTLLKDEMAAATNNAASEERALLQWMALTDDVLVGARSAVDVLNDFLNYDKIESGKLTLELSVVRIFELIEKTAEEFKLPAEKKKLKFVIKTPTSSAGASPDDAERFSVGDVMRLTQVFRNLLSNAVKFTPEGGSVEASAHWIPPSKEEERNSPALNFKLNNDQNIIVNQTGSIVFSVTDSGAGMTAAQVQEVFCQGTQFNANSLQGGNGSGLGTWIAKGIVQQHGGTLSATSKGLGKGSSFSAILPVFEISQDCKPPAAKTKALRIKISEEPESPLHILVVDDAGMNLKLLMRLLTKSGHTCEGAEDGIIAVRKVKTSMKQGKPYDVILMDFQMPNMDGPTAASKIRAMGSDAFIVGVTGNLMAEDIRHFKEHGANHVLPKPIKLPDLEALFVEYDVREQTFNGELSMNMVSFLDLSHHETGDDSTVSSTPCSGRSRHVSMTGCAEDIV